KALLVQAQIVLKRRSLHRRRAFPLDFCHRVRSLHANFHSGICLNPAPALAREAASSSLPVRSRSRHIILCK
ncbi:uncharacterized, partial [Tachysurus ichikawai]